MAPRAGNSPIATSKICNSNMSTENSIVWSSNTQTKENQRPPVYNAEDYILSLKKYSKRPDHGNGKSIYDSCETTETVNPICEKTNTISTKNEKSILKAPPKLDCEMSLKQFGSITDLLTKLRADLRASFPSFVQEFISNPLNGVTLLLEILRAIQLSQSTNINGHATMNSSTATQRPNQSYQRRALLDELTCLQCLHLCSTRSPEAINNLSSTPVGLLPLVASATGQGIRSRILALQLLITICDKTGTFNNGLKNNVHVGHTSVSEALSTLRLRCGEPVRFRLLVGMLNSGGGSGELQTYGLRFINTFLESSENTQSRLYLQAELFQAGFEPQTMTKTISSSSQWLDTLRTEVKRFEDNRIDVDKLLLQARNSARLQGQMIILERRVQILQEEKMVLTSMERRLQERCADLQRDIIRLQQNNNQEGKKTIEKMGSACQISSSRRITVSSKNDDEGISSSETGQSLSPEPMLVLPQDKYSKNLHIPSGNDQSVSDVIEVLDNVVNDAEKQISMNSKYSKPSSNIILNIYNSHRNATEKEIVPVNLLPQPPKKSRSLTQLLSIESDLEGSDYELLMLQQQNNSNLYYDDFDCGIVDQRPSRDHNRKLNLKITTHSLQNDLNGIDSLSSKHNSTNRELLNVIMDARENDESILNYSGNSAGNRIIIEDNGVIHQQNEYQQQEQQQNIESQSKFNGVYLMTEMNASQKYPKPDVLAAVEAKRVTKSLNRIESYASGLDSMIDIVMTSEQKICNQYQQIYQSDKQQNHNKLHCNSDHVLLIQNHHQHQHQQLQQQQPLPQQQNNQYHHHHHRNGNKLEYRKSLSQRQSDYGTGTTYTNRSKVTDIPSGLY